MSTTDGDLADLSLMELFRSEVEGQLSALSERLVALEHVPGDPAHLEVLMRAAHSIKGAARMVDVEPVIRIAHAMEDCFVAAQHGVLMLNADHIDSLLRAGDMVGRLAGMRAGSAAGSDTPDEVAAMVADVAAILDPGAQPQAVRPAPQVVPPLESAPAPALAQSSGAAPPASAEGSGGRAIRVSADCMDRILGLAGEAMVESRGFTPHLSDMRRLKQRTHAAALRVDALAAALEERGVDAQAMALLQDLRQEISRCRHLLVDRVDGLAEFAYRSGDLSERLHNELISSRMRPFADGVEGLQRLVRDLARDLGKEAVLEIGGMSTPADREVLAKIKTPLNHLLRNAVDHGIEPPEERRAAGKPTQGQIRLDAYHRAGMLSIVIEDDGRGIDLVRLREKIVARGLVNAAMAEQLSEAELLEFIFLPGFSTRDNITEVSGRGVGMDVVQDMVREIRGLVTASTRGGRGTRVHLQLPLTLSVIRALLVAIGDDSYAIPLARIDRILRVPAEEVHVLENRQYITVDGAQHIGLVSAAQIFGDGEAAQARDTLCVVVVSDRTCQYGIVVEDFLGERELAVRVLDPRLGKIKDISAAAFMDDGDAVLIIDVDDMVRSIDKLVSDDRLHRVQSEGGTESRRRRILIVDDSITVREVERKLLQTGGYDVEVAVDGMDGWNAVRGGDFSLVITDVDMPRMDGIELVRLIKHDPQLQQLPVMIVSYKDRDEDRRRGLDAGADYYLTKGSFHDETLREAVIDLIGKP